jgi:hypothetical protein
MRTETKNELRQQLNNALAKNRALEKEISQHEDLDAPERLHLSVSDVCALLDLIEHAHASLRWDAERAEEKGEINISAPALQAMYKDECRMANLRRSINDQCRYKYEWSSLLQTHEAVMETKDMPLEIAND